MIESFNWNRLRRKSITVPRTPLLGNSSTSGVANGYPILRLPGSSEEQKTEYGTYFMLRFKNGSGSGSGSDSRSIYVPTRGPGIWPFIIAICTPKSALSFFFSFFLHVLGITLDVVDLMRCHKLNDMLILRKRKNKGKLYSILGLGSGPLGGPDSGSGSTMVRIRRRPVRNPIHVSFFETVADLGVLFGMG